MIFPIICGLILILVIVMFGKKPKKEKVKEEVIPKEKQPVLIELIPKGTNNNPVKCIINDTVPFKVFGYLDYKKQNLVELNGSNISWHKMPREGIWEKDFGVENRYSAPNSKGYFDVYVKYRDSKLITSCKVKILVEG